ncbi:MAG TPA: serine/threonine-protein kinase [Pyrinomonadaceae bacterium]|nr:serine/threonine-protein kinase [Pyrinomonadaceae bacterium]
MSAENWVKIKKALREVLDAEPSERQRILETRVPEDIRAEVESLLAFEKESADFLSLPITDFSKDFVANFEESAILPAGQKIGIYEIVSELGIGGMGAVYLAERTDGKFAQKVAVKMLKREFNVGKIRQNFKREKEILSKLNHPNIALLLDAGTTADSVPYLVMEYVEGVPIDEFCRRENLSLVSRLKLFNKMCEAVSFAHRNLIVHRDLKPSNILVTAKGEPKLLDFGISKLLDAEEKTLMTAFNAMTPEYASPEQIKGETVSTASDIYSLGVVLYKILTDSLPIDLKNKTNGELLKAVTEDEPIKPSTATSFNETENPRSKIQNPKSMKGDLDNIVLKALCKEPERRYKTVEQFSGDIWRHLDGLPVLARPATTAYRASKFFKRNKVSVIAVALIFMSLLTGIAIAFWQAREARAHSIQSEIETKKAREEQRKSEKVTKFVSKIFGYANPGWFAEGAKSEGNARVIDVVEELSGKIDTEFADEADVAAELHSTFAGIFHWISRKAPNEEVYKIYQQKRRFHALRGLELRKQFYGEYHELVARDMFSTYGMIGTTEEEKAAFLMKAILMMRDTNPRNIHYAYMFESYAAKLILPEGESLHEAFRSSVIPPTDENRYQIAERMLREALSVWQLHYPPDHGVILAKNCWLAYSLAKQDKWTEFNEPYQTCKQIETKAQTEESFKTILPEVALVEKALKEKKGVK